MFLSRTVLTIVELFRTVLTRRRSLMIGVASVLVISLMVGAGVVARRSTSEDNSHAQLPARAVPPAGHYHFVKPVSAAVPFDTTAFPVTTVSAASFDSVPVAPDSIVSAFGTNLAPPNTILIANTTPLPTELGGTTVEVNGRKAGLFFVSPNQINYLMPAATELNVPANVVVKTGNTTSTGSVMVVQVAPGIFTANATGRGVAAANILRRKINGSQSYEPISQFNPLTQRWITKPIDLGPDTDLVFLVLYLTGIRQAADDNRDGNANESVRVLMGGNESMPAFAGAQPDFSGLDQINVLIPRTLLGRGVINVLVTAMGNTSNPIEVEIAGAAGGPKVGSVSGQVAQAGLPLTITGTGFSPKPEDNIVRIAGHEATVVSATTTQLDVMVPFGVEAGTVSVITTQGEGRSPDDLAVRTSVSGVVENTLRVPLKGVAVKVLGTQITAVTNDDGVFVLTDVPEGFQSFTVDGGSLQQTPPYPTYSGKIDVRKSRDNQYTPNIALQQATGSSGVFGGGSFTGDGSGEQRAAALAPLVTIQTDGFQFQAPSGVQITTPDGLKSATLTLTPLLNARAPVALPYGYYSTSIVQITPFNVKLDPGAKLVFPNTDKFPAGTQLALFRYDQDSGKFVREEKATVSVSSDGMRIETGDNDVKITSYYFAALFRNTTTIVGQVFGCDRKTPAQRVLVRFRGQESFTDGNGSYVLRYVPVDEKELVMVEVNALRTSTRVDRLLTEGVQASIGGITKIPNFFLPCEKDNRPPTILAQPKVSVDEGKRLDVPVSINDPEDGQPRTAVVSGASFASLIKSPLGVTAYTLRLDPGFGDGGKTYTVTITATDSAGASAKQDVEVIVNNVNRAPSATSQSAALDEDGTTTIKLEGADPDGDRLTFKIASQPANGILTGDLPNLTYKPNLNFNGTDRFTFTVNDGVADSAPATVTITVRPVNDPPVLTVPGAQTGSEGGLITFPVSAFDPDTGQNLTITATNMPEGAAFTPVTASSGQFRWTPNFNQAGTYTVSFKVADNGTPQLSDTKDVRITVNDTSLLVVPGSQTVNEGQQVSFDVTAVLGLPLPLTITLVEKPAGADFPDAAVNIGKFKWTPGNTQAGTYTLMFKATIASLVPVSEIKQVQVTVVDVVHDLGKEGASFSVFGGAGPAPQSSGDEGDGLGTSLATGDLNGDGVVDLAVGAPGANGAGLNSGKVYVFFGRANLTGSVDLAQQKADVEILGDGADDRFGSSLAIGDLNGDGKNDLVIGAPLANAGANADAGKVYVVFGGFTPGTSDSITKLAGATILGGQRSEHIGTSLAVAAVVPKSVPAADLIVGAPGFDSGFDASAVIDVGAVFVFFGGAALTKTIDLSNTAAGYTVTGTLPGGGLGTTLAVGNFNGDGLADFAVGAPLANANGVKGSGVVYLALGAPNLSGTKNTSQAASLMLTGGAEGDNLGSALAMGDLNGDGRADLILGASGASAPGTSRPKVGAVYVVYGVATPQNRPADVTFYGVGANNDDFPDALGKTLAVGDFNGDGVADLAIGAPGADSTDPKRDPAGAVYIIFGARTGLTGVYDLATKAADWTVLGADSGDNLGTAAIAVANLNASDPADVILGIPKARSVNNSRPDAGEVRVVYGVRR